MQTRGAQRDCQLGRKLRLDRLAPHSLRAPNKRERPPKPPPPVFEETPVTPAPAVQPLAPRPLVSVVWDKLMDAGENARMHWSRASKPSPDGSRALDNLRKEGGRLVYRSDRPVALVLGAGWASHAFMKGADVDKFDVVVCSPRNHFVFTPMLPSAAVGSVEPRSLLEPVRVANPHVAYFEASVDSIDLAAKVAHCSSSSVSQELHMPSISFDIPYTYVLIAVGEAPATFDIPGVEEHCFFMKEVQDCVRMRRRIQQQFELAELMVDSQARADALRFVVVGGGATGVEFAATLSDFVFGDLKKRYPELVEHVQVLLIQSDHTILTVFHETLRRKAMENLDRLKVKVMTDVKVTEVKQNQISLSTGEDLGCGLCLWSAGNQTRPLIHQLIDQVPEQRALAHPHRASQKLAVDQYLRVIGVDGAFCLGDCSRMVTGPLPPTAQVAGQQGAYVACAINNCGVSGKGGVDEQPPSREAEDGKALRAFHRFDFTSLGIMAYIGDTKAVVRIGEDVGVDVWGTLAFLLCRSAYIAKQVSTRNRMLLIMDWLKSRVFGRDLSIFY